MKRVMLISRNEYKRTKLKIANIYNQNITGENIDPRCSFCEQLRYLKLNNIAVCGKLMFVVIGTLVNNK